MSARIAALKLVIAATALLAASAAGSGAASAKVRTFKPTRTQGHTVLFRLRGLDPPSVRSAYLKAGARRRSLSVRRVRRGVKRGLLRVRVPRGVRRPRRRPRLYVRVARPLKTDFSPYAAPYPVPPDAHHVSPAGSDDNPGTATAPWQTLDQAAREADPGQTVVLHPGTYSRPGSITRFSRSGTSSAPIVFVGEPGQPRPRVLGQLRVEGDHVQVRGLLVDGPTGPVAERTHDNPGGEEVEVWIRGSDTLLEDSEVRQSHWHAGIYVSDGVSDVSVVHNHIHHNGAFGDPAQSNLDHGVYWDAGAGLIADNLIDHNLAYGVHLYPSASRVVVARNTITGHGKGGVIVSERSRQNLIEENAISRNGVGIRSWQLTGEGNVARRNRVWDNPGGNFGETDGLLVRNNTGR